jgi:hypothetical protein
VFGHGSFVWMLQTDVALVLLEPGLDGTAGLHNVDLTTFTGHAVHAWNLESKVVLHRPKETASLVIGDYPWTPLRPSNGRPPFFSRGHRFLRRSSNSYNYRVRGLLDYTGSRRSTMKGPRPQAHREYYRRPLAQYLATP